jgi:predicted amidohydrolase
MIKIALGQIHIDQDHIDRNISAVSAMIDAAVRNSCSVLLLPEVWPTGFKLENRSAYAEAAQALLPELQHKADRHGIEIMGSYITRHRDQYCNEFVALLPGEKPASYKKIHLFPSLQETQYLTAGRNVTVFQSVLGLCGASICYDLRFPMMYKKMAKKGAIAQIISAQWPASRIHHWNTLLQARAIETVSYVIAANAVGKSGKATLGGGSAVISPEGDVIAQPRNTEEELVFATIDPALVSQTREKYPFILAAN